MAHITISIPAYNDAGTIAGVIQNSLKVLSTLTNDYAVLVINDGSRDSTSQILREIKSKNPRVKVWEHAKNMGFGTTIREAYTLPESEWVFFIPGDGQIPPEEILKLYPYTKNFKFILGYRKDRKDPLVRKINSRIYNFLISLIAGQRIRDVNSVALVKKEALNLIEFKSQSAFIHAEILLEAVRNGALYTDAEIGHKPRTAGKGSGNKWKVIYPTIRDMIQYALFRCRAFIS